MEIDHGFTTEMKFAVCGTFTGGLSSKIYPLLKNEWYNVKAVYPVVESKKEVHGDKSYASLDELPETVDVVVTVHKKDVTLDLVKKVSKMNPRPGIWFMPRTISEESIKICEENGIKYGSSCLMGHREFSGISRYFNMHNVHGYLGKWNKIPKKTS